MIDRLSNTIPVVTIAAAVADSQEISMGPYAMGMFVVILDESTTEITWYAAEEPGGTYYPAIDEDGVAVVQTVQHSKAYQLPVALSGARAIKGVATVGGAGEIALTLKS